MTSRIVVLCSLSLVLLCVDGCVGPWAARQSGAPVATMANTVVVMDRDMRSWQPFATVFGDAVTVDRNTGTKTVDGRLLAHIELKNNRNRDLHLQIQTVFRDGQGAQLSDQSNWEYIIIPRQSTHLYSCTSMQKSAATYQVRIRKSG